MQCPCMHGAPTETTVAPSAPPVLDRVGGQTTKREVWSLCRPQATLSNSDTCKCVHIIIHNYVRRVTYTLFEYHIKINIYIAINMQGHYRNVKKICFLLKVIKQ